MWKVCITAVDEFHVFHVTVTSSQVESDKASTANGPAPISVGTSPAGPVHARLEFAVGRQLHHAKSSAPSLVGDLASLQGVKNGAGRYNPCSMVRCTCKGLLWWS